MASGKKTTFQDWGIDVPPGGRGDVKVFCPECMHDRKPGNRGDKPLSVNVDKGAWNCFNCGWTGGLQTGQTGKSQPGWWKELDRPRVYTRPDPIPRDASTPANDQRKVWAQRMKERGIPADVLKANGVDVVKRWMPQVQHEEWVLAYPYYLDGQLINTKFRSAPDEHGKKHFTMVKDAEQVFWRLDKVASPEVDTIIVTEGENDALAMEVAGFLNAVSVPSGAPDLKKDGTLPNMDGKMAFLENERSGEIISQKRTIILATDADRPGQLIRDELARRLGPARCKVVTYPEGCKDPNDVLIQHGADVLKRMIHQAKAYPIEGILSVDQFRDSMDDIYQFGFPPGPTTGWKSLDLHYHAAPRLMTTITGVPETGKSRFVNALAVHQAMIHGTKIALCSPEYQPTELLVMHLAETYLGKTMQRGHPQRMSEEEYNRAIDWVNDHFHFIVPETTTIKEILDRADLLIQRHGVRMLIIDPWTEVELPAESRAPEVRILQDSLSAVQRFTRTRAIHTAICAHPTAQKKKEGSDEYKVVEAYGIFGGSQWFNKNDFIISLWRPSDPDDPHIDVHVQKAKFQHLGKRGMVRLRFDLLTGRYEETSTGLSRVRQAGGTDYAEYA